MPWLGWPRAGNKPSQSLGAAGRLPFPDSGAGHGGDVCGINYQELSAFSEELLVKRRGFRALTIVTIGICFSHPLEMATRSCYASCNAVVFHVAPCIDQALLYVLIVDLSYFFRTSFQSGYLPANKTRDAYQWRNILPPASADTQSPQMCSTGGLLFECRVHFL